MVDQLVLDVVGGESNTPNNRLVFAWIFSGIVGAVACAVSGSHLYAYISRVSGPLSPRQKHSVYVMFIVIVFEVTAYITLLFVKTGNYMELIRHFYEAIAMYCFYRLIIEMLGGDKAANEHFLTLPEGRYFSVPPCCCVCAPCCMHSTYTPFRVRVVKLAVEQLFVTTPLFAAINLLQEWTHNTSRANIVKGLESGFVIICLWGLFVLYFSSRVRLAHHRLGTKFLAMKLGIIFVSIQRFILSQLVKSDVITDNEVSAEDKSNLWQAFLITIEFFFIAFIMRAAFPLEEFDQTLVEAGGGGGAVSGEKGSSRVTGGDGGDGGEGTSKALVAMTPSDSRQALNDPEQQA